MIPPWLITKKWFTLDCLATGLDPTRDRIVFIAGCARVAGSTSVTTICTLVNPGIPIPPEATAGHGISDEVVKRAPSFAQVLPTLLEISKGHVALAWNAKWSVGLVRAEMTRLSHPTSKALAVDLSSWAWQSEPPIASPWAWSFEATCKRWGVEIKREAHGMLADALACWPLWWAIVDRTQELMPSEFEEMLKLQRHFQFRQAFETYADKFQQEN